jgi:hypothetical protein
MEQFQSAGERLCDHGPLSADLREAQEDEFVFLWNPLCFDRLIEVVESALPALLRIATQNGRNIFVPYPRSLLRNVVYDGLIFLGRERPLAVIWVPGGLLVLRLLDKVSNGSFAHCRARQDTELSSTPQSRGDPCSSRVKKTKSQQFQLHAGRISLS